MIAFLFELSNLRRNLRISQSEMRKLQNKKLKQILSYAYNNVRFYHKKFDSVGIKPDDIKNVDDITKIPLTEKSEIQKAPLEDVISRKFELKNCIERTTSGSTGIPLTSYVDRKAGITQEAEWSRALFNSGLKITDKMAMLKDPRYFIKKRWFENLGLMRRKWISIFEKPEIQAAKLLKYEPDTLRCYPSNMSILSHFYRDQFENLNIRIMYTSGELLDRQTRDLFEKTFHSEVFDNYVCNEFGNVAWECKEHVGYHINVDNKLVEFIQDENPVSMGEYGEIVCTSLNNYAMPLIRYQLGDIGSPDDEQCSCGVNFPLMKVVEGRTDQLLSTVDGNIVSPLIFFPYPFTNFDGILQFRVIQEKHDKIVIQMALDEGKVIADNVLDDAREEIREIFGDLMQVEFELLDEIKAEKSGKIRKIVSHVPVRF